MLRSVPCGRIRPTWKCAAPWTRPRRYIYDNASISHSKETGSLAESRNNPRASYDQAPSAKSPVHSPDAGTEPRRRGRGRPTKPKPVPVEDEPQKAIKRRSSGRRSLAEMDEVRKQDSLDGGKMHAVPSVKVAKTPEQVESASKKRGERLRKKAAGKASKSSMSKELLENPWQDLVQYLETAYASSRGDKTRAHVISQSLCDDVIQRLDRSLDQHIGCDILDINPGTCVWSKTIHERLKPRRHILIEPDADMYRPVLDSLLNAPDSRYTHVQKSGLVWPHLQTILSPQYLPEQHKPAREDPKLEEKNNTLLVLVNLGFWPMKGYRGFNSMAQLVLYQFMTASRTRSLFQRYGRVRFLVWTNDDEKHIVMPRDILSRKKSSAEIEIAFEEVNEVASSTIDKAVYQRRTFAEEEALGRLVVERMSKAGYTTPQGRESVLLQQLQGKLPPTEPRPWAASKQQLDLVKETQEKFDSGKAQVFMDSPQSGKKMHTPEYRKLAKMLIMVKYHVNRMQKARSIFERYVKLIHLHKQIVDQKKTGADVTVLQRDLQEGMTEWEIELSSSSIDTQSITNSLVDDYRATSPELPLLNYDRRKYEPLLVRDDEFFPAQPLCLLDFQPAANWPLITDQNSQGGAHRDALEYIVGTFFTTPAQSVNATLKSLWPGAHEWIVDRCPSLKDPSKGGAVDLDTLRARSVTREMFKEILEAWSTWPFRPSRHELISKLGSEGFDPETAVT